MRPSVARTFSAITVATASVFFGSSRRGASKASPARRRSITRFTVLWVRAAQGGRSSIGPHLLIGGDDVHPLPR